MCIIKYYIAFCSEKIVKKKYQIISNDYNISIHMSIDTENDSQK